MAVQVDAFQEDTFQVDLVVAETLPPDVTYITCTYVPALAAEVTAQPSIVRAAVTYLPTVVRPDVTYRPSITSEATP